MIVKIIFKHKIIALITDSKSSDIIYEKFCMAIGQEGYVECNLMILPDNDYLRFL